MSENEAEPSAPADPPEPTAGSVDPESVEGLFVAALGKKTQEERSAFLDEKCAADDERRERVEALLHAYADAGSFLEQPAGDWRQPPTQTKPLDEIPLDFLSSSDKSGCLGALGAYDVLDVIGRGGMGIVLRALDAKLNRVVAIKVLAPALASLPNARRRFLREAQAAAAISHPHVVTIHAVDEGDGQLPFLVMECVVGHSLQQKIESVESLKLTEVLRIGRQVAEGLAAAHEQGLIHRDVKPSNILLENGVERVKLTDFGLARAVDDVTITRTGEVSGTPQYMSPEQAKGERGDHRSDLFSLGCVLYAMCTGRSPFRAAGLAEAIRRVCEDTPRPVNEINPEVPAWLIDIIDRLLLKNPDERFQSAEEVADLLSRHLARLQHPATMAESHQEINRDIPARPQSSTTVSESTSGAGLQPARQPESRPKLAEHSDSAVERTTESLPVVVERVTSAFRRTALLNGVLLLLGTCVYAAWPHLVPRNAGYVFPLLIVWTLWGSALIVFPGLHLRRLDLGNEALIKGGIGAIATLVTPPAWVVGMPAGGLAVWLLGQRSVRDAYRVTSQGVDASERKTPLPSPLLNDGATIIASVLTLILCLWLQGDTRWRVGDVLEACLPTAVVVVLAIALGGRPLLGSRRRQLGISLGAVAAAVCVAYGVALLSNLVGRPSVPGPFEMLLIAAIAFVLFGVPLLLFLILFRTVRRNGPVASGTDARGWRDWLHDVLSQPRKILAWLAILVLSIVLLIPVAIGSYLMLSWDPFQSSPPAVPSTQKGVVLIDYDPDTPLVLVQVDGGGGLRPQTNPFSMTLPVGAHQLSLHFYRDGKKIQVEKAVHVRTGQERIDARGWLPAKQTPASAEPSLEVGAVIVEFEDDELSVKLIRQDRPPPDAKGLYEEEEFPMSFPMPGYPPGVAWGPEILIRDSGTREVRAETYSVVVFDRAMGWFSPRPATSSERHGFAPNSPLAFVRQKPPRYATYSLPPLTVEPGGITTLNVRRDAKRLAAQTPDWSKSGLFRFLWHEDTFPFTKPQAKVVQRLFTAWADGAPDVPKTELLAAAFAADSPPPTKETTDSASGQPAADTPKPSSLADLFNAGRHPAWNRLIVAGTETKTFRFTEWPTTKSAEEESY